MRTNNKEQFLKENNVSEDALKRCSLDWDLIFKIGEEHHRRTHELTAAAEYFAKTIQRCSSVHSVRWRVKSPEHLMVKLIRKTDPESEFYSKKYESVTSENYHEIVTDLVGVRAIHLFKDEFAEIDKFLCQTWDKFENTTVYKRIGDLDEDFSILQGDTDIKDHEAGYRSIHYVLKTKPSRYEILVEVQVRTIFEEGWSEIDHTIRYPNFSDNELVGYFLKVFNRLAGSADEMGSFVKSLVSELDKVSEEMKLLQEEQEHSNTQIEDLFKKLEDASGKNDQYDETVKKLKSEVIKLKAQSKQNQVYLSGSTQRNLNFGRLRVSSTPSELASVARSIAKMQKQPKDKK